VQEKEMKALTRRQNSLVTIVINPTASSINVKFENNQHLYNVTISTSVSYHMETGARECKHCIIITVAKSEKREKNGKCNRQEGDE
jgi:metal-responsive CopG/Arc/MetJ family transcriptional regulator